MASETAGTSKTARRLVTSVMSGVDAQKFNNSGGVCERGPEKCIQPTKAQIHVFSRIAVETLHFGR